jgi:hypothetical protein
LDCSFKDRLLQTGVKRVFNIDYWPLYVTDPILENSDVSFSSTSVKKFSVAPRRNSGEMSKINRREFIVSPSVGSLDTYGVAMKFACKTFGIGL